MTLTGLHIRRLTMSGLFAALLLCSLAATATEPTISTIAGRAAPYAPTDGDGGPAIDANLRFPWDVAVDSAGILYLIDDSGGQVRAVSPDGIIQAVTSSSGPGNPTDGDLAVDVQLTGVHGLTVSAAGTLYLATHVGVYEIDAEGRIYRIAGDGVTNSFSGDGGDARLAGLYASAVAEGPDGSLYIADQKNYRVRKVSPDGIITTIAGTGERGNDGDGGPATDARIDYLEDILLGHDGELFISSLDRIRRIDPDGTISTYAGGGTEVGGATAATVAMLRPDGMAMDHAGNLYVSDHGYNIIRKIAVTGDVEVVVGSLDGDLAPQIAFGGDGGPATDAKLANPRGIALGARTLYIADSSNFRIRAVAPVKNVPVASDFNGDGISDLLWRHRADGYNQVWRGARSDDIQPMVGVRNTAWDIVAAGDFDGDGKSDVFWRESVTGANSLWPAATPGTAPVRGVRNDEWLVEAAGDFDGDGRDDLFWRNMLNGVNAVWPGGHPGDFPVMGVRNHQWHVAGAGDFDGDGQDDVFWRDPYTGANVVWRSAQYYQQQSVKPLTALGWEVAGIGDFDGDGRDDVLWRNYQSGHDMVWPAADGSAARQLVRVTDTDWQIVGVGDYAGDGTDDLLWRDTDSGRLVIWDGGLHAQQRPVGLVSSQRWQVEPARPIRCESGRARWALGMVISGELAARIRSAARSRFISVEYSDRVYPAVVLPDQIKVRVDVEDGYRISSLSCT